MHLLYSGQRNSDKIAVLFASGDRSEQTDLTIALQRDTSSESMSETLILSRLHHNFIIIIMLIIRLTWLLFVVGDDNRQRRQQPGNYVGAKFIAGERFHDNRFAILAT